MSQALVAPPLNMTQKFICIRSLNLKGFFLHLEFEAFWRHGTRDNDIQHSNNQHNETQHNDNRNNNK